MPNRKSPAGAAALEVPDAVTLLITAEGRGEAKMEPESSPPGRFKVFNTWMWAAVVFVSMLLVSLGIGLGLYFTAQAIPVSDQIASFRNNIQSECQTRLGSVASEMDRTHDIVLDVVAAFYASNSSISSSFWNDYTNTSSVGTLAIRSFAFCPAVSEADRPAWERAHNTTIYELTVFQNGSIDTSVPAFNASTSPFPFYLPLLYRFFPRAVPTSTISSVTGSDTVRARSTMLLRSLKMRQSTLSSPVVLANGASELGFVFMAPIFARNASLSPIPDLSGIYDPRGWDGLTGYTITSIPSNVFFAANLVGNITIDRFGQAQTITNPGNQSGSLIANGLSPTIQNRMRLAVYDTSTVVGSGLTALYSTAVGHGYSLLEDESTNVTTNVLDRNWTLVCTPTKQYYDSQVSAVDVGKIVFVVFLVIGVALAFAAAVFAVRFIRARKRTKNMLEALYADSKAIVKAIPDPLLAFDNTGRIVGANKAALDATGYSAEDIGTIPKSQLFIFSDSSTVQRPESAETVHTIAMSGMQSRETTLPEYLGMPPTSVPLETVGRSGSGQRQRSVSANPSRSVTVVRKDGTRFPAEASFSHGIVLDEVAEDDRNQKGSFDAGTEGVVANSASPGQPSGGKSRLASTGTKSLPRRFARVVVFRDVTEKHEKDVALRTALEKAEEADRRTERVLRFLCHELRNPVHAIVGLSDLILDEDKAAAEELQLGHQRVDELKSVSKAGNHIASLVSDVLLYTDLQRDQLQLSESEIDMRRLLSGTWHGGNVKVAGHWSDPEERVFLGDSHRMRDAIRKMLDYAVLTLGEVGGEVLIEGRVGKSPEGGGAFTVAGSRLVEVSIISTRRIPSHDGNGLSSSRAGSNASGQDSIFLCPPTPGSTGTGNRDPFDVNSPAFQTSPLLAALEKDPFHEKGSSTGQNFGASGIWLAVARSLSERMGGGLTVQENGDGSVRTLLSFFLKIRPRQAAAGAASTGMPVSPGSAVGDNLSDSTTELGTPGETPRPPSAEGLRPSEQVIATLLSEPIDGTAPVAAYLPHANADAESPPAHPVVETSQQQSQIAVKDYAGKTCPGGKPRAVQNGQTQAVSSAVADPVASGELSRTPVAVDAGVANSPPLRLATEGRSGQRPETASEDPQRLAQKTRPAKQAPSRRAPQAAGASSGRILVVEDNQVVAKLTTKMLTRNGYSVDVAEDGLRCIDRVKTAGLSSYDVVLMDLHMPVLDGHGAAAKLRELGYNRAIVAVTAYTAQEDYRKCLENGAMQDVLAKPVKEADLLQGIQRWRMWRRT